MSPRGATKRNRKSLVFPQQPQASALYPRVLPRGRQVQRSLWDPLGSCPVHVARTCCHLRLPAGFAERHGTNNEQTHSEESVSPPAQQRLGAGARGAGGQRGQPMKELLHRTPCIGLPPALRAGSVPLPRAPPLLSSAISVGRRGRPWQCPRPHRQARSGRG